ncbi:LPS translocon maturation chaperone LptM [Halotalea alkalilenta]|uniref:LPS translocon maturation chaperone LptM n=1 Tax=Halotalea alkalilenta TaxID=376489 RepID=UPI0004838834
MIFSRASRLTLASLALVLAGCGQTGPLYMPDDQEARERYDPGNAYGIDEQGRPIEEPQQEQEQEQEQEQPATGPDSSEAAPAAPSQPTEPPPVPVAPPAATTPVAPATPEAQAMPEAAPAAPAPAASAPQAQPQPPRVQQTLPATQGSAPPSGAERWRNVPFTPYPAAGGQTDRGVSQ